MKPDKAIIKPDSVWYWIWINDTEQFYLMCDVFFASTCNMTNGRLI